MVPEEESRALRNSGVLVSFLFAVIEHLTDDLRKSGIFWLPVPPKARKVSLVAVAPQCLGEGDCCFSYYG